MESFKQQVTGSNSHLRRMILLGAGPEEEDAFGLGGSHGDRERWTGLEYTPEVKPQGQTDS